MNPINRFKSNYPLKSIALGTLLITAPVTQAASLPQQAYLPLESALKAATVAMKKCTEDGYRVSVAVVDRGGNLLAFARHPLAGPHTVNSSQGKAFTAASMGRPTVDFARMIGEKPFLAGLRDMDERLVILGGGLPILIDKTNVGGIGVGGAPGGQLDGACAEAGLDAINKT